MNNDSIAQQQEIGREIDRIKSQFPDTREVYRQVCRLLFLQYGITPTANGLYQLVRKGSMGRGRFRKRKILHAKPREAWPSAGYRAAKA